MKPDKHKQKRSQQYKKKHGVKTDKDKNTCSKGQGSDTQPIARGATYVPKPTTQDDSSSSESDEQTQTHFQRRRGLVSNWERYEELPADLEERVTSHGADFSVLLQGTSSAVSQFRFADEIALDDDLDEVSHHQSCLSIDPNHLAAAFNCIPLHKKLNVDESLFEKEDLELFQQEADKHRNLYEQQVKQQTERKNDVLKSESESIQMLDNDCELEDVLHQSCDLPRQNCDVLVAEKRELPREVLDDLDVILSATEPIKETVNTESNIKCDKDSAESSCVQNNTVKHSDSEKECITNDMVSISPETKISTNVTNLEDHLDKLLSFDDHDNSSDDISDKLKSTNTKATSNETDELEDWLDSVLDA